MGSKKWILWLLLPLVCLALSVYYHHFLMPITAGNMDHALFKRGIGTPFLKWVNGYLAAFFSMRAMGNVSWMALPMLLFALFRWKELSGPLRGVTVFVILSAAVIGGGGGFNSRYAFTMIPVLLPLIVVVLDHFMTKQGIGAWVKSAVFIGLVLVTAVNSKLGLALGARIAATDRVYQETAAKEEVGQADKTFADDLGSGPEALDKWLMDAGVAHDEPILVNNHPIFFYTTDRPGRYYWCGNDSYYGPNGPEALFEGRSDREVALHMENDIGTRYILSDRDLSRFEPRFEHFLTEQCDLLAEDKHGFTIHRLRYSSTN